ncbi:hypothetical protein NFI96_004392 [Prochilodus magdalenae]|nr:hypothetical protein NFI96_004392 [Prochilodus magdalenae]
MGRWSKEQDGDSGGGDLLSGVVWGEVKNYLNYRFNDYGGDEEGGDEEDDDDLRNMPDITHTLRLPAASLSLRLLRDVAMETGMCEYYVCVTKRGTLTIISHSAPPPPNPGGDQRKSGWNRDRDVEHGGARRGEEEGNTEAGPPPPAPPSSPPLFESCWSCRLLSGSALLFSAGFVYQAARRTMRRGGPTSMGTVAQIVFASGLAAWGMVVIMDPVGKATKKTKET